MLPPRRRTRVLLALLGVAVVAGAVASLLVYRAATVDPGNVSNPNVEFDEQAPVEKEPKPADRSQWPLYGFSKDHRRYYRTPKRMPVRGPWGRVWRYRASALLEFPPVIYRGSLYQLADDGVLYSLRKNTGRLRWKRDIGFLSASSPAIGGGSLYATVLERGRGVKAGRVVSLRLRRGGVKWSRNLSSRSESSPLLHRGRIYFGTEGGTLYCLNAHNGRTVWRYQADGAIKGSPTLSNGKLYFGDYGGHVHAVRLTNGHRVWEASPAARALRSGRFYATAAVAYGRVFIGSTDGRQYSLSARNGRLAWARQTGNYVYSSAAVHDVPKVGPTVFFGSYDGHFYALSAKTGGVRWKFRSGGRISGAATIIGRAVFFADLGKRLTYGLSLPTGKVFFKRGPGAFDPMISDGRHLFQTGHHSVTALLPAREAREELRKRRERARAGRKPRDETGDKKRGRAGDKKRGRAGDKRRGRSGDKKRGRSGGNKRGRSAKPRTSRAERRKKTRERRARQARQRRARKARAARARALRRCRRHTTRSARRRCRRAVFGIRR
ncbi:MAG TPA: PQQ-binding-like beta-propeller repeat protein [Solirubrobacteraceae bacterium]